jgi:Icc-related predicted phosphoesterase
MLIDFKHQKICAFADTHGRHHALRIPCGVNILVCAGDVCDDGNERQMADFFAWFAAQDAPHKLFVPGNHDIGIDSSPDEMRLRIPAGITCIETGGVIWRGIRFLVLPVRLGLDAETAPGFLPPDIDILVTHCPPKGILDEGRWGCPILRDLVKDAKPRIHLFGHCHKTAGKVLRLGETEFRNVIPAARPEPPAYRN